MCQHFKSIYYNIYVCVWSIRPTLLCKPLAYVNNFYEIELDYKSHDQCLFRNIKHRGTCRKVLLADFCIAYTKIKPLKCKVVEPPQFSHKLIEYILG